MNKTFKIALGILVVAAIALPAVLNMGKQGAKKMEDNGMEIVKFDSSSNIDAATGQSIGEAEKDKYNRTTKARRQPELIEETPEAVTVYSTGFQENGTMFWIPLPTFQFGPKAATSAACGYGGTGWFGNGIAIEMGEKPETVTTAENGAYLYNLPYDEKNTEGNPKLTMVFEPEGDCGWGGEAERQIKIPHILYEKWKREVLDLGKRSQKEDDTEECEKMDNEADDAIHSIVENAGCEPGGAFKFDNISDFQATGTLFGRINYFCPDDDTSTRLANALAEKEGMKAREKISAYKKDCLH